MSGWSSFPKDRLLFEGWRVFISEGSAVSILDDPNNPNSLIKALGPLAATMQAPADNPTGSKELPPGKMISRDAAISIIRLFLQYARDKKINLSEGLGLDAIMDVFGDEFKRELQQLISFHASDKDLRGNPKAPQIADAQVILNALEQWGQGVEKAGDATATATADAGGEETTATPPQEKPDMFAKIAARLMLDPSVGGVSGIKRLKPFDARTGFGAEQAQRDHPIGSIISVNGQEFRVSKHDPSRGVMGYPNNEKNQKAERRIKYIADLVVRMLKQNNLLKEAQNNEKITGLIVDVIKERLQNNEND
jgi:hypothetical protein